MTWLQEKCMKLEVIKQFSEEKLKTAALFKANINSQFNRQNLQQQLQNSK